MRSHQLTLMGLFLLPICACASLLGVDLDVSEQPIECSPKSCEQLGVQCGSPDNGCGETLSCSSDCSAGCTPSQFDAVCSGQCGVQLADGCGGTHKCPPCPSSSGESSATDTRAPEATTSEPTTSSCEPAALEDACAGQCETSVPDGCGDVHRCPAPEAPQICYNGAPCTPQSAAEACADKCNTGVSDGCGGVHQCPAPTAPQVCHNNTLCTPLTKQAACQGKCGQRVSDGCGGTIDCRPNAANNEVCYQSNICLRTQCNNRCGYLDAELNCGTELNCSCSSGYTCTNNGLFPVGVLFTCRSNDVMPHDPGHAVQ